jgi:hypothetical protein
MSNQLKFKDMNQVEVPSRVKVSLFDDKLSETYKGLEEYQQKNDRLMEVLVKLRGYPDKGSGGLPMDDLEPVNVLDKMGSVNRKLSLENSRLFRLVELLEELV